MSIAGLPFDEVGQLWILEEVQDPDLAPAQIRPIGANPVSRDAGATEAALNRRHAVHGHDPAQPAAAFTRPSADGLAKGSLFGRRMIQGSDHLDVDPVSEGEDEVARPERGMQAAINEGGSEVRPDALHHLGEFAGGAGI